MATQDQAAVQKQVFVRCPKGMKMPRAVKRLATLLTFASKDDRREYMRILALAEHDAKYNAKRTNKETRGQDKTQTTGE
jgi:hypothetical protein